MLLRSRSRTISSGISTSPVESGQRLPIDVFSMPDLQYKNKQYFFLNFIDDPESTGSPPIEPLKLFV